MKTPFFSIIIPTFNSENTLNVALLGIVNQDFIDFEVLIIDNLSTDRTVSLAKELNDNRIKIYSGKDFGIYDAMNKAIHLAKGNWLYFMGSDDRLYDREVLENIYNVIKKNQELSAIYGNVVSSRFGGLYAGEFDSTKLYKQNICHQAVFLKKEVFKLTGPFNLKYKMWADYDNNIKWFFNTRVKKRYVNLVVADYADGGFSSKNVDNVFLYDKDDLFIKYLCHLEFYLQITLLREAYIRKKENREYYKYFIYKFQVILLLEFNKLKKRFICCFP
jgi:glycosyltransferase involved in cell wall biosynthesis